MSGVDLGSNASLGALHERAAALLSLRRDVILPSAGRRTWPHGVGGHVHRVETHLLDKVQGVLELLLCLPGETHDDVGVDGRAGDALTDAMHQRAEVLDGVPPRHAPQDRIIPRLDGQLPTLADLGQRRRGPDDLQGHILRVRGQKADAPQALDVVNGPEDVGQGRMIG